MARRGHGEGSIYLRSDGRWAASISVEGGKRKTFYGKTRKEVQEQLKTALHQQQQGMLASGPQQTIKQFLMQWLEDHKHSIRVRSYERYEEMVRLHIIPVLGRYQLQKLTAQQVRAFYTKKLNEGLSPTTVNGLHAVLHKALDDAVRLGILARNVCDAVSPPRRAHFEIQPLSTEQAQQLLAAAKGHNMEALFALALTTGMRRREILALKWQDIDFAHNTLHVRRIFTRRPGNRYIEAEPAGLTEIRFHDLRHSAATILLSMGVHPKVVQELLGHNQISMTMDIYSHVLPTMQKDAVSKLNDALQG